MDELRPRPGDIETLAGICSHWAAKTPISVALTAGERNWTYGEIDTSPDASHRVSSNSVSGRVTGSPTSTRTRPSTSCISSAARR